MRKLITTLVLAVALPACSTVNLSAAQSCVNWLGQTIPENQRTPDNCATQPTAYAAGDHHRSSTTPYVGTVYTPNGSYQVTRSGSSVFVNKVSRR